MRRARLHEVENIAKLITEELGTEASAFTAFQGVFGGSGGAGDRLGDMQLATSQAKLQEQLASALRAKQEATVQTHEYRLRRELLRLRAQLAQLRGERAVRLPAETPDEQRQLAKWQRARQFLCLVAEECGGAADDGLSTSGSGSGVGSISEDSSSRDSRPAGTGRLIGAVTLSLATPEARLPPPLPTKAKLRAYVSNMAVVQQRRRMGVASALLKQCEQIGAWWLFDAMTLHVDQHNESAKSLYERRGYQQAGVSPGWMGPPPRYLMIKSIKAKGLAVGSQPTGVQSMGGKVGAGGVFVWQEDSA